MIFPIQCHCGYPVGAVYDAISEKRRLLFLKHMKEKNLEITANNIARMPMDLEMVKIFEEYNIKMPCCKARFISNVNMHDMLI